MPIYTYKCKECELVAEKLMKRFNSKPPRCMKCNGQTKKIPSLTGRPVFKGNGFYCNDYPK